MKRQRTTLVFEWERSDYQIALQQQQLAEQTFLYQQMLQQEAIRQQEEVFSTRAECKFVVKNNIQTNVKVVHR